MYTITAVEKYIQYRSCKRLFRINHFVYKHTDDIGGTVKFRVWWSANQIVGFVFLEAFFEHRDDDVLENHGLNVLIICLVLKTLHELKEDIALLFHRIFLEKNTKKN